MFSKIVPSSAFSPTGFSPSPSSAFHKDTLKNIERSKEFVVNLALWKLREEVNISSGHFARGISEAEIANLKTLPSKLGLTQHGLLGLSAQPTITRCWFKVKIAAFAKPLAPRNI